MVAKTARITTHEYHHIINMLGSFVGIVRGRPQDLKICGLGRFFLKKNKCLFEIFGPKKKILGQQIDVGPPNLDLGGKN